jgi:hypothetical protein
MTTTDLKKIVQEIVAEAQRLITARTSEGKAPVNYACIFAQSETEYAELIGLAGQMGSIAQKTAMGPVFHIAPLPTAAGNLELLKIRKPCLNRPERGDADFTVADYESFKKTYLGQTGFGIIKRPEMEMIELTDPSYKTLAYFSHPTLASVLKINIFPVNNATITLRKP